MGVLGTNQTDQILFVIRDEQSKVFDDDYIFYFVNKLNLKI